MTTATAAPRKSLEPFLKDDVEYYKHQTDAIRRLINMKNFLLADDMGLGKSLQSLTVHCIDVKMGKAETCLIVCPVTLRDNWAEEIQKFTRIPFLLFGEEPHPTRKGETRRITGQKRHQQLLDWMQHQHGPRFLIVNYEQLTSEIHKSAFRDFTFDTVIYDEAHYLKNPDSKRTKAAMELRKERAMLLTGTPMLNQVNELWTLLNIIDPKRFPKYWSFVNRYCVFGGYENRQIVGVKNQKELVTVLGEVMIRRMKNDVLSREKPTYVQLQVKLSPEQQELYNSVANDLILPGSVATEVENPLTKFLRLKQICGTPYSIDPSYPDSSFKLDRAVEIVKEFADQDEKIVVFTQFRGVLDAIDKRLRKAGTGPVFQLHGDIPQKQRQPEVARWAKVKGPATMACMTQVAGVGLNMVAASTVLFIDKLFVPGLNKQAVDRLDRIGQEKPVQVFELIARGTVEQRVEEILKDKTMVNQEIVEGGVGMSKLLSKLTERMKRDLS